MTTTEIKRKLKDMAFIWDNEFNDDTDRLFGFMDDYETPREQYEAFKGWFINYNLLIKEKLNYVLKYLSYYCNYEEAQPLINYAVKDIINIINKEH